MFTFAPPRGEGSSFLILLGLEVSFIPDVEETPLLLPSMENFSSSFLQHLKEISCHGIKLYLYSCRCGGLFIRRSANFSCNLSSQARSYPRRTSPPPRPLSASCYDGLQRRVSCQISWSPSDLKFQEWPLKGCSRIVLADITPKKICNHEDENRR
jgi:hypothetical protein